MKYTVNNISETEDVIRLHKLGLGSVKLSHEICYLELIRTLYNEGIKISSDIVLISCRCPEEIIELLDMVYKPSGDIYIIVMLLMIL